jgi:hypothetical protein
LFEVFQPSNPPDATEELVMPLHIRFLTQHALIGFAIGLLWTFVVIIQNVANIGTLIMNSGQPWLISALLGFMIGSTCSGAQIGFAIMFLDGIESERD